MFKFESSFPRGSAIKIGSIGGTESQQCKNYSKQSSGTSMNMGGLLTPQEQKHSS